MRRAQIAHQQAVVAQDIVGLESLAHDRYNGQESATESDAFPYETLIEIAGCYSDTRHDCSSDPDSARAID